MKTGKINISLDKLVPFDRDFFGSKEVISYIGSGSIGGKASGLALIKDLLAKRFPEGSYKGIDINIPRLAVIATDVFDRFMELNNLYEIVASDPGDDRLAHAFIKADFPVNMIGDLRALVASSHTPLAVRSSSLLEDAMFEPFAGVYATKMIPNNQPDVGTRFKKLNEAIKFVYASTFFKSARDYIKATGKNPSDEKMAVIIQEVIGSRHSDRFYPDLAGVVRSYNFYSMGRMRPEDGVVDLALGLGKTIVDGGLVWSYSPVYPRIGPPVGSPSELLKTTQTEFWCVNMGQPPAHDPVKETEYMLKGSLADAEYDGVLARMASTYRPQDDRVVSGIGPDGPRIVNFAPILVDNLAPVNDLIKEITALGEEAFENEIEIEFAATLNSKKENPPRLGFLQIRPMVVSHAKIDVGEDELIGEGVLAASNRVLGNGLVETVRDVVYVRPDIFESRFTRSIAVELAEINRAMIGDDRPYLLIGFGRWGSSDPWLGIPVEWSQISGARVIVEATLPDMNVDLSQGSHFFHNLSSFGVCYFSINHTSQYQIDWSWLDGQKEITSGKLVRHVQLTSPMTVKVDGRSGRGVILK